VNRTGSQYSNNIRIALIKKRKFYQWTIENYFQVMWSNWKNRFKKWIKSFTIKRSRKYHWLTLDVYSQYFVEMTSYPLQKPRGESLLATHKNVPSRSISSIYWYKILFQHRVQKYSNCAELIILPLFRTVARHSIQFLPRKFLQREIVTLKK